MNAGKLIPETILHVKTAKGIMIINPLEVLYLEAKNKHTFVYLNNMVCIETHHLLKWYGEKLLEPQFYRCHNSFIVNCFYIGYTCGESIILDKNIYIPLSRKRKQQCKENLIRFKFNYTAKLQYYSTSLA